ncbi:MAG TPA: hypothetical protein VE861_05045 [Gemmatimonadaceae bacterium]|nr:hypothetical protein [Gemmatimonadaceae bacterium]
MKVRMRRGYELLTLATVLAPALLCAQGNASKAEVRQIVTFLFQPGRAAEASAIYQRQLLPIYADVPALRRFRAYHEAESPEPLDLVVVSSYDGMAGMDSANSTLRRAARPGKSAFAIYGTLAALSQSHHDQFIEMMSSLSDSVSSVATLTVFQYIRVAPGMHVEFEAGLRDLVRRSEKDAQLYDWSETGRVLVGDGWDYVRIFGIRTLADWHRYQRFALGPMMFPQFIRTIAARKTIILRHDAQLSVR